MRIQEITYQNRNDFSAIMECEHCEAERELKSGYDDYNYHHNVIPKMVCHVCKKNSAGEVK